MADYADRRRRLCESIEEDGFLAYNYEHSDNSTLRYLTGFTGEGALLVTSAETVLLTDSRYTEQGKRETNGITIEETRLWMGKDAAAAVDDHGLKAVGFASRRAAHNWVETMEGEAKATLVSLKDPVAKLRITKEPSELDALRLAAAISDRALEALIPDIRAGMTEAEIALRLEWLIRTDPEAEAAGFSPNVSTGPNSALNHYDPALDPQPLREGDLLLFDFGACVDGYRSDITRTFSVGTPTPEALEIYELVLKANLAAIAATKAGISGVDVDAVARETIANGGHSEHFGHGLGHGIGLEVHEGPSLSPRSKDTLEPGMVATIEPGIYLPGIGGVRIEDDVIVTDGGCDVISTFPKDRLIEVG
jgi:Xaa-Pro aminopeptidase